MIGVRLSPDMDRRLAAVARKAGCSKDEFAREAVVRHIEDIEDFYIARKRLGRRRAPVSLEQLERDLAKRIRR